MKFDTSGIVLDALAEELGITYGVPITSLTFTPQGEEAFCFIARDAASNDSFVRAQKASAADLEAVYAAVAALHDRCGLTEALAPIQTTVGAFTWQYDRFTVARFPFISGTTAFESGVTDAQLAHAARVMAHLHGSDPNHLPPLPGEQFANPFEPTIERSLTAAATLPATATDHQQRVRTLLLDQQSAIDAALTHMRQLRDAALRLNAPVVPTHGDPNFANFLIDESGHLHLTDWGEFALGPRERDLTHFTGEHFAGFLETYLAATGPLRLHRLLFRFYAYRWVVQEIADYATRILFDAPDPDAADHAWAELQPYLPIPHADIESGVQEIASVLGQLADDGRLEVDER